MPLTRIRPKCQITIPKAVLEAANLEVGDVLDASVEGDRVVLTPKRSASRSSVRALSATERKTLARAEKKIKIINRDLLRSRGLTAREIDVAIKAGLIDEDQAYFWTEECQKDIRASESDFRKARVAGPFETAEELIAHLNGLKQRAS